MCAMSSSIPFGSVDDPPMAMVVVVAVASGGQGGGGEVAWSAPGAAHRQQLCGPNTEGPRMVCARSHSSPTDRRPRDRGGRTGVGRDRRQRGRPVVQSSASHTTCPWMVTICKRQWRSRRPMVSWSAYPHLWGKSVARLVVVAWRGLEARCSCFTPGSQLPRTCHVRPPTRPRIERGGGGVVRPTKTAFSPLDVLSRQENCACGAMARRLVLVKCSPEHWLTSTKQMA
jgi:hypothetical protein